METTYETKTIEHLGLVSGMFDELGMGELIDTVVPQDKEQRCITVGQAVKAMVLNGLGFANRRLYLTARFFANKPVERLIGEGVSAKHLNDDALGQALEDVHAFGETELFALLGQQAVKRLGLPAKVGHLDSTSFHVDGVYNSEDELEEGVVHITKGYSRDHRPDLNQVALELIAENQASLPLSMKALSGNASDKTSFQEAVKRHVSSLQGVGMEVVVSDSAGYSQGTIRALQDLSVTWVMSVPSTLKEAKRLVEGLNTSEFVPLTEGYQYARLETSYAGVEQRWLIIRSEAARERAAKTAHRQLFKRSERERKAFDALCREEFLCEEDAWRALHSYQECCEVLEVLDAGVSRKRYYEKRGRPAGDAKPERVSYGLSGFLAAPAQRFDARVETSSRFILASNDVTGEHLNDVEVLQAYKGQSNVERGFRFLKDPMFLANTLYLKKPERIMALLMVMTLCLLIYAALEHRIRQTLQQHGATVLDQKGKPTRTPTAKWVFELFLDVHLLLITGDTLKILTMNLEDELRTLLNLLGPPYAEAYS
jgi:transposase